MIEAAKLMMLVMAAQYLVIGVCLCVGGSPAIGSSYFAYAAGNVSLYFAV